MTGRRFAADDYAAIGDRLRQLQDERSAEMFRCTCSQGVGADGAKVKQQSASCPVHGSLDALVAMARDPAEGSPFKPSLDDARLERLRLLLARHDIRVARPASPANFP